MQVDLLAPGDEPAADVSFLGQLVLQLCITGLAQMHTFALTLDSFGARVTVRTLARVMGWALHVLYVLYTCIRMGFDMDFLMC